MAWVTHDLLAPTLTEQGAIVGTPAYMAPEQIHGAPTDARTDQFSFCIALWEALFGQRPFPGRSVTELWDNVTQGKRAPVSSDHAVPGWIRRVLDRGLSIDPEGRYPNLDELLTALQADPTRRRRTWLAVGAGAAVIAGCLVVQSWVDARQVAACEAEGASIDEVWNDSAKSQLHAALLATKAPNAESTIERVLPYFEAQAQAWKRARTQACVDARVHETWDEDTLRRAESCLDERRLQFEALLAEFTRADAKVLQMAISAAVALPSVDACLDAHRLSMLPELPDDLDRARAVQTELARALALGFTANYEASLTASRSALAEAEQLAWAPLTAAARVQLADSLSLVGEYADAEDTLERAYFEAAEAGALEVAAQASISLTYVVGYELARHDEGVLWSRHTDVLLANLGTSEHDRMRALADNTLALVYESKGEYQEAKRLQARALQIDETLLGSLHMDVANDLDNLARIHYELGDYERAKALHERGRDITEQVLGPEHPDVASALNHLANVHESLGERDEARRLYERALEIREAVLGPEHPNVANSLNNLAVLLRSTGDYTNALALHERALAIRLAAFGPEHPDVAISLNNLASLHLSMGAYERAKSRYEQALSLYERTLGPDHQHVATALNGLGLTYKGLGEYEQARELHTRALAIRERALGPHHTAVGTDSINLAGVCLLLGELEQAKSLYERGQAIYEGASPKHAHLGYALDGLAKVALAQGRPADAVPLAERAVQILVESGDPPRRVAQGRFTLARALWGAPEGGGRDRERSLTLAQQAREGFRGQPNSEDELGQVEAFLAEQQL